MHQRNGSSHQASSLSQQQQQQQYLQQQQQQQYLAANHQRNSSNSYTNNPAYNQKQSTSQSASKQTPSQGYSQGTTSASSSASKQQQPQAQMIQKYPQQRGVNEEQDTEEHKFSDYQPGFGEEPLVPVEIIKNRLCWISGKAPPKNQPNAYFFNIDADLQYEPFFADFGPHNLSNTYRFVTELEYLLSDPEFQHNMIYHYTGVDSNQRTNAAFLMGAFSVIILGRTADQAWAPFAKVQPPFSDYRDAGYGPCTYKCTILDCLRGLEYAIKLKWFNVRDFKLRDYEYYERVENGDLNEIIPEKFIAFSGPSNTQRDPEGYRTFTPEDYVPIFKKLGVTLVIRLNKKAYEAKRFTDNGIKHLDLYFLDGSCPPDVTQTHTQSQYNNFMTSISFIQKDILKTFMSVCEAEKGKVAVHCKAGLGRTGSLIAMYAMKHYHFPAADFIGWIRIARPGSILGPQQYYLNQRQSEMWEASSKSPIWKAIKSNLPDMDSINNRFKNMKIESKGEISPEELKIASLGEKDQGDHLVGSKHKQIYRK